MSKKLLVLVVISIAAMLTSCGNTDASDDIAVVHEETSITTAEASITEPTYTKTPVMTTTPQTTTEPEETVTVEVSADETAAETEEIKSSTVTTAAKRSSQGSDKTTTKKKTPAEKIPATTEYKKYTAPPSGLSTDNSAFPTVDTIIKKAASLLGTPYMWGNKGYTGIYNLLTPNKVLSVSEINKLGIDCSGLVYYTMTQLGYKSKGFMFVNPMPIDTVHWLSVNSGSVITYGGVSSKVDVEKNGLSTAKYEYWQCADGSTITPGTIVVGENLYDDNHAWIYMGEFESRNEVIAYLKTLGVPDRLITSKTVGNGKGSGGTHWRIESNGSNGVVINNNTEKENSDPTTYNIYAFRVTQKNASFEISTYDQSGNSIGVSPVDGSSTVYGIYRDKACTSKIGEISVSSGGTGKASLPPTTYYAKQLSVATGYVTDSAVYAIKSGKNKLILEPVTRGVTVNLASEDGNVGDCELTLTWTENGNSHSQSAKANGDGTIEFSGLNVYDMSSGKAITYTVSISGFNTDRYIAPDSRSATLVEGNADFSFYLECVQTPEGDEVSDK